MRKVVNFDFKLDGATASLWSVPIYEAPLIHSLFVLRASTSLASEPKGSVAVDNPPDSEISEVYSEIHHAVDDEDIRVWHVLIGHLSLPDIKWLPNAVRVIQLHAGSQSTCTCKACIMGKMFRNPFHPSEDKEKTRRLEFIHSDMIGPMPTLTMRSYRYIIMFTDDHSRYTEVYFMNAKSEAPAKFKEYVAKVEQQHPKSKVGRIGVDGGGEYASREKFLEFVCLFVIILHSPRRGAQLSYHKPADHWWSWHLINILYPCPSETSCPSIG